ncbi:MAG: AAA family ATPase, partial [Deltaproteobacteria bacterium]|nr:AAA family ATPase [Kofleriaceae bacterium]
MTESDTIVTRPPFPQPVRTFAGRSSEIARILAHIDSDTLFFLYGVGGIGKSELAYRVVRELGAQARWAEVPALLVEVRPATTAQRVLAQLLPALGATRAPRRRQASEDDLLTDQLELLARLLEARPHVLFLDDVHHLAAGQVAAALGYLARRVQKSRILVASRREIVLPPDAPPPVVTTLGPLDAAAVEEMTTALAERLAIPRPEPAQVMRATHGSPFHIHQLLVRRAPDASTLEATFGDLSPPARRLLRAAAVIQQRLSLDVLDRTWAGDAALDDTVRELAQRFLCDATRGELVVHDLIREAVLGSIAPEDLAAAHHDAAELCLGALRHGDRAPVLLAVDAVEHFLAAGRIEAAWDAIERWYSPVAAAGSEHLLRAPLARLRGALPARQVAIDLL